MTCHQSVQFGFHVVTPRLNLHLVHLCCLSTYFLLLYSFERKLTVIIQCSMFYTARFIEKRNVYLSSHTGTIYPSYPSKPKLWPYMQFSAMLLHIFVMQAITLQQRIRLLPVNCSAAKKYLGSCLNYLMVLLFAVTSFTHNICRQRRNKR